jgi:hypothetical protein
MKYNEGMGHILAGSAKVSPEIPVPGYFLNAPAVKDKTPGIRGNRLFFD